MSWQQGVRAASALIICGLMACLLAGCASATVERHVVYQEVCAGRFVELMRSGETSREDEQDFIRASERAWHFLRLAMGLDGVTARLEEDTYGEDDSETEKKPVRRRARR